MPRLRPRRFAAARALAAMAAGVAAQGGDPAANATANASTTQGPTHPVVPAYSYHAETFLSGYARDDDMVRDMEDSRRRCEELDFYCSGFTCTSDFQECTVRAGRQLIFSPYQELSYRKVASTTTTTTRAKVRFALIIPGVECGNNLKSFPDARNVGQCATLVDLDLRCGRFFDWSPATDTCRCMERGVQCEQVQNDEVTRYEIKVSADTDQFLPLTWSNDSAMPACELPAGSGYATGICAEDIRAMQSQLSFCGDVVQYRACVPASQPLWGGWNASRKDQMLSDMFKVAVEERIAREQNLTADVYVGIHYMANPDCVAALKNALCWYNFPKCGDTNVSLPLCRSTCERYYQTCNFKPSQDGLYNACRDYQISREGLFGASVVGLDQQLAEHTATCERIEYVHVAEDLPVWMRPPLNFLLLSLVITLVLGVCCLIPWGKLVLSVNLFVPFSDLQVSFKAAFNCRWCARHAKRCLKRMSEFISGNNVLATFILTVVGLLGFGIYLQVSEGFSRYEPPEPEEVANASAFVPASYRITLQTGHPLSAAQVRQLTQSCSCTGAAAGNTRLAAPCVCLAVAAAWQASR